MSTQMRTEYPRPQFVRNDWVNLNGEWEFDFDDQQVGEKEQWYRSHSFSKRIQVPFCYQSKLSGIGDTDFHDTVWYRRSIQLDSLESDKRYILHFGAVDYLASVWVNGQLVTYHEGGHTPFQAEITHVLTEGKNDIVVKAQDFSKDVTIPRGKQYWKEKSEGIFYTRTTGIWQTVWLETVPHTYLEKVRFTPDLDRREIQLRALVDGWQEDDDIRLETAISFKGEPVVTDTYQFNQPDTKRAIGLDQYGDNVSVHVWSPHHPNLYDVELTLYVNGTAVDHVQSYFGMRKISVENGEIYLNNHPYFTKMVLDQGYFPDGILTAPSDDDLRRDVELTKEMGFNGARKHQKIEDPRYLYWCDKLGLIVWGEMANAYDYSEEYVYRMNREWMAAIERDYNHPCIVAWVPLNESWGVPRMATSKQQQDHGQALYYLTKSLDQTRLVISNDGWEHVKSDIATIHDYEWRREVLTDRYSSHEGAMQSMPAARSIIVPGYEQQNTHLPVHVSEFGGIAFKKSDWEGWGYSGAKDDQDFVKRLIDVVHPLIESPHVQGYCYTQLTDVEQEINGLLTYDRKPKIKLEWIKEINSGRIPKRDE